MILKTHQVKLYNLEKNASNFQDTATIYIIVSWKSGITW